MNEIGNVEMEQISGGAVGGEKRSPPGLPNPVPTPVVLPPIPQPYPGPNLPIVWGD